MINIKDILVKFIISFCVGIFIITYLLKLPFIITNQYKIVNEYYIENYIINIPLDFIFVTLYFLLATLFIYIFNIKDFITKLFVIGITTVILTSSFCYYFQSYKMSSNFFSRWFHTVGYTSVLYDVILLCFIYIIYNYLNTTMTQ